MKQCPFILILFFSFFTSLSQSKNHKTDAEQKIIQQERNIVTAFLAGDTTKISRSFASDYKGYYDGYSENKEMVMKNVRPLTDITIKDMQMDARIYGMAAVVNGVWEMKIGNQKPVYRQFMDVFIRHKDGWKIIGTQQATISAWKARDMDDSDLVTITAKNCETESTLKSLNSDVPSFIRFKNNTAGNVTVYWINYSGQRDPGAEQIHKIATGKSFDLYTYVTHPFIVIGLNGKCYGIYEGTANGSITTIKD